MEQTNYRDILRRELETRCQKNPRYSLRAFARDLGLSAPRLSHVLNGHHGISRSAAEQIGRKLGWSSSDIEYFVELVESQHARSKIRKVAAQAKAEELSRRYQTLEIEHFRVISDWYHFAIMELTQVEGFQSTSTWIAKALGISAHEATAAIARLKQLGLLEDSEGVLRLTGQFFANPKGTPSEAVRKFHRQFLEKALMALTFQTTEERDFSGMVLAIDHSRLPEARAEIKKFRDAFDAKFSSGARKTQVYGLGVQLFRLQEERNVSHHSNKSGEKHES